MFIRNTKQLVVNVFTYYFDLNKVLIDLRGLRAGGDDLPHTDQIVGIASEECGAVSTPGEGYTLRGFAL